MYIVELIKQQLFTSLNKFFTNLFKDVEKNIGPTVQDASYWTIRNYILERRWTFSRKHWRVDLYSEKLKKIKKNGNYSLEINIPGHRRAFQSYFVKPVHAKYLTIPINKKSKNKRAKDFPKSFVITKKNGKKFIAQRDDTQEKGIVFLYVLKKQCFMSHQQNYLPDDNMLLRNMDTRIRNMLNRITLKNLKQV